VTELTPRAFGFLRSRWCCGVIVILLWDIYQLHVSPKTVRRWRHREQLVWRRPRPVVGPPPGVPAQSYGPQLASLIALCSGAYRLSKQKIVSFCRDVLGIPLAVGEVCKIEQTVKHALRPALQQAWAYIQTEAPVSVIDKNISRD
jgi:hypothetical protein